MEKNVVVLNDFLNMDFLKLVLDFFNGHWLVVSFLAPLLWALVNVIDVYFVGGVYKDELDGTIISGLFQIVPIIFILFFLSKLNFSFDSFLLLAVFAGFLFNLSFYFYFKALFRHNDVALLQILWSLTIVVVPVLSFVFFGEKLGGFKYLGMLITLIGAVLLSFNGKLQAKLSWKYFWIMMGAVGFLSLSMVIENQVYTHLAERGQNFLSGFLFFSIGAFLNGLFFVFFGKRNPLSLVKKYFKVFVIAEVINVFGIFASQRAIDQAPSVSYVAVVESFVPVFIMIFSLLILFYFLYIVKKRNEVVELIYKEQIVGIGIKIFATLVMAIGIYFIS
ncbi:MAG: hypothetical protein US42_C0010G0022 [Candidatus Magasanikbacteria bacterium GW2011_GWC2_37_14]|uniref:EamA domain-containing protein n=1 Tax=Candidatus Magasanikbacteria bacterium GW2011_GWC2_37_14 TaxID=1619046 RepID=A0A0G0GMJ0_9BACT|nr:MAG: hypothetical protein US42_C0010G0022 [Candidatus Magasanikbacteria bacterium GW2011_GWC2_37_14]